VGGKTSTTTSQVQIPPEVMARYNAVNARAEGVAANPFQRYGETAEAFVAPINQQQLSGIANVNAMAGAAQPYIDAARAATTAGMGSAQPGELDVSKYMNPFQQQVIDATLRQMGQANEQAQSGALGTAVSSGAFGGDRAGIAAANLANQQGMAMGSTLAGLNAQNFGQALQTAQQQQGVTLGATQADLARYLQGGGQLANLGVTAQQAGLQGAEAQINAGTLQQQTEQAGKTALVNQFMQEQGYPFQVAQFLANIAMGTGALSGSTTTTTQPTPFFSDRRLKEDVKRIGKTDDGLPIYSFKYKGDDAEQTHVGFMADEVEKVKPEAVGLHPSGYKTVDYAKATENSMGGGVMPSRAGQGFAGGGVAGPYGSSAGSQVDFGGYVPEAYLPISELMMADPAFADTSNRNIAALMENSANFGANLQKLDEQFGRDGSFWDMFRKQKASGGAAYLRSQPSGGLVPNSAKTYLSDTLESQRDADKPELKTASGDGGGGGKSPAENIADLGKMAMMFFGFKDGGRAGYQDGGTSALDRILAESAERNMPQAARDRFNATEGGLGGGGGADRMPVTEQSAMDKYIADRKAAEAAGQAAVALGERPTGLVPAAGTPFAAAAAPQASPATPRVGPTIEAAAALPKPAGLVPAAGTPLPNFSEMSSSPRPAARPEGLAPAKVAAPQAPSLTKASGGWNEIAPNIIARESGGDFDALYGFANREGGPFEGVKITDMTVDQAIDFSRPGSDYANWSRSQLGYTATPMGGLQIVGTTLRDIKDGMGLTGDEVMTPELQMQMGEWLYNNRGGEQPWAASAGKGPAGPGGYAGGLGEADTRRGLGLGQFLKENAGNKDFLLSLLSGLGTMASSPSLYLGSAVLQGIGGAANTYMAREQQRADITAKNLENLRAIAMDTMTWNEMNGTDLTPAEYASMTGSTLNVPSGVSAQTILSGAYTPTTGESGLRKMDYRTFQNGVVDVGGRTVLMQNDPASLQRFINDNGFADPTSPLGRQVAVAKERLAEINASGGMTTDVNDQQFQIPGYTAVGDTQAQAQANREASAQFRADGIARMPVIDQQISDTDKQTLIFTRLQAGALTNEMTSAAAVMDALGLPAPEGTVADKALAQEAIKIATSKMINELGSMPGGAPAAELDRLAQIAADPNLQPEAVKMILTMQKAALLREQDKYRLRDQWNRDNPGSATDQFAYEQWFSENRPYASYYESVRESMPLFAGELGSSQKPHTVANDDEFERNVAIGHYFVGPDGVTRQRTQ